MWRGAGARRVRTMLGIVVLLVCLGTIGYAWIENWSIDDGFFMTVITLSTVGYGETQPLTDVGRLFTSVLIFSCLVVMTLWSASLTSFIVGNELSGQFLRRRMLKMVARVKDHTIICGAGLMGQAIVDALLKKKQPVVVIDNDEQVLESLRRRYSGIMVIHGSATNELTLADANVLDAKHVVASMSSEVDNLLVAITCKDMKHNINVYARSDDTTIANRMRKAGVDEVISPSLIGGGRVATTILA